MTHFHFTRKLPVVILFMTMGATSIAQNVIVKVNTEKEPIHQGKYHQNPQSLADYQCPEWFRNAKFGIWAHWGPQCQAEDGD